MTMNRRQHIWTSLVNSKVDGEFGRIGCENTATCIEVEAIQRLQSEQSIYVVAMTVQPSVTAVSLLHLCA